MVHYSGGHSNKLKNITHPTLKITTLLTLGPSSLKNEFLPLTPSFFLSRLVTATISGQAWVETMLPFISAKTPLHIPILTPALQIRASQRSITTNLQPLTIHIYHVMITVTGGFSKKSFFINAIFIS